MGIYRIAEITVEIQSPDKSYADLFRNYICDDKTSLSPELGIRITEEDIEEEKKLYSTACTSAMASSSRIHRELCKYVIKKGGFFLHSAVVEYNGMAYGFLAPSGTGKSTHIKLWRKLLKNRVDIINGDKPFVMPDKTSGFLAYGTPWCGKEGWQRNVCAPLAAICIIKRGEENKIKKISPMEALDYVIRQTLVPTEKELVEKLLENIDNFLSCGIKCYILECNMDISAAVTSFEAMTGETAIQ